MLYYIIKLFLSAGIIVAVTEVAKLSATLGGLIKSLPLISLLAILWLYVKTYIYPVPISTIVRDDNHSRLFLMCF